MRRSALSLLKRSANSSSNPVAAARRSNGAASKPSFNASERSRATAEIDLRHGGVDRIVLLEEPGFGLRGHDTNCIISRRAVMPAHGSSFPHHRSRLAPSRDAAGLRGHDTQCMISQPVMLARWGSSSTAGSTTTPCRPTVARSALSASSRPLAANAAATQPEGRYHLGADRAAGRRLASQAENPSPLAKTALRRQTPRVGAVCPNRARTALCGGRSAMSAPTAIADT